MYLENAQSFFHIILHHSTVIQGNSFGVQFTGLLAELSLPPPPANHPYVITCGTDKILSKIAHEVAGKNTRQVLTPP